MLLQGSCRSIELRSITDREWKGGWVRLQVPLNTFDWFNADEGAPFYSCHTAFGAWDVNLIEFK